MQYIHYYIIHATFLLRSIVIHTYIYWGSWVEIDICLLRLSIYLLGICPTGKVLDEGVDITSVTPSGHNYSTFGL